MILLVEENIFASLFGKVSVVFIKLEILTSLEYVEIDCERI